MSSLDLPKSYQDCQLFVGAKHLSPILQEMVMAGYFASEPFDLVSHGELDNVQEAHFREEEAGLKEHDIRIASLGFERTRKHFRTQLQAIVRSVFEALKPDIRLGLDLGSGATGEMWSQLMPSDLKPRFLQMDLNPDAVAENKKRHPEAMVLEGSYLNLLDMPGMQPEIMDMVTGLSTLDATFYPRKAFEEIAKVLKPAGIFLHFQDVRPGPGVMAHEMIEQERLGRFQANRALALVSRDQKRMGVITPEEMISEVEMFRRRMQRVLEGNPQWDLLMNDWVVAKKPNNLSDRGHVYFQNLHGMSFFAPGQRSYDEASGVMTVVRKKGSIR